MLIANNLSCERDDRVLFHSLSFAIDSGEVLHISGANGSGKTSLIRILLGLAEPSQGEVLWQQHSISQHRYQYNNDCCYIGHKAAVKACLTPRESLKQYTKSNNNIEQALADAGLAGYEDVTCQQLSAGQQRRVAIARLRLTKQPLWLLDEPFTALDSQGIALLEKLIAEHAQQGGVAVLSSHQPFDIADVIVQRIDVADPVVTPRNDSILERSDDV